MRIFVNASTCVVGGGVQVAACFVNHLSVHHHKSSMSWFFALSEQVAQECDVTFLNELRANNRIVITTSSPGSLIKGRNTRVALSNASKVSGCDRVFSIFGPSYVKFHVPEYMGFADAFAFSPTDEAYKWHPWTSRVSGKVLKAIKMRFASGAQRYWVEAPFAKVALARSLGIPEVNVSVIPNSVNTRISKNHVTHHEPEIPTFFFLAAAYWHKNHMVLPEVLHAARAMRPGINLRIITTIPCDSSLWIKLSAKLRRMGIADMIINAGPLQLKQVAEQLGRSTAVMQISLLETFSSTYLEAMSCGVPLLVSDRVYARDVCGDAALYANPHDPSDIARKMIRLMDDSVLRSQLAYEGRLQISKFPDAETKNERLLEFCTQ